MEKKEKQQNEIPVNCECDNTHENNKTVCQCCWELGYRHETSWWRKENKRIARKNKEN